MKSMIMRVAILDTRQGRRGGDRIPVSPPRFQKAQCEVPRLYCYGEYDSLKLLLLNGDPRQLHIILIATSSKMPP